jgi:hypothetical protein
MPNITYYAPAGVTSINLSDGSRAVVINGQITVDSKFRNELEAAGCSANADTDNSARVIKTPTGRLGFSVGDSIVQPDISAALTRANLTRAVRAPIAGEFVSAANQGTFTWGLVCQIDTPFDAVRPILFHVDTAAIVGVTACAAAGPDFVNDKHGNALTWTNATFGGAASGTLPAGAAPRPGLLE